MTDPPQLRRLHSSTSNTEQYTPIQEYQVNPVIIFYSLISQLAAKYSLPPFISIGYILAEYRNAKAVLYIPKRQIFCLTSEQSFILVNL